MILASRLLRKLSSAATGLDTQTVTTGSIGTSGVQDRNRGFISGTIGSLSDGTSNIYGGSAITELVYDENGGSSMLYRLSIPGASNSGWTYLTIDGTKILLRSDASFSSGTWYWLTTDTVATQVFGGASSSHTCVFS